MFASSMMEMKLFEPEDKEKQKCVPGAKNDQSNRVKRFVSNH